MTQLRCKFRQLQVRITAAVTCDSRDTPHVHGSVVSFLAEEQLGRSVPPRHDAARVGLQGSLSGSHLEGANERWTYRVLLGFVNAPREAKVGNHELTLIVDQQVGGLHVAMQDQVLRSRLRVSAT